MVELKTFLKKERGASSKAGTKDMLQTLDTDDYCPHETREDLQISDGIQSCSTLLNLLKH